MIHANYAATTSGASHSPPSARPAQAEPEETNAPPAESYESSEPSYGPITGVARSVVSLAFGAGGALWKSGAMACEGGAEGIVSRFDLSEQNHTTVRAGVAALNMAGVGVGVAHATADPGWMETVGAAVGGVVQGGSVLRGLPDETRERVHETARNWTDAITPDEIPGGAVGKFAHAVVAGEVAGGAAGFVVGLQDGFEGGKNMGEKLFDRVASSLS